VVNGKDSSLPTGNMISTLTLVSGYLGRASQSVFYVFQPEQYSERSDVVIRRSKHMEVV